MTIQHHLIEALRYAADQPCHRQNCGTICLCGSCHARRAIAQLDPDYRPRYTKNYVASKGHHAQSIID